MLTTKQREGLAKLFANRSFTAVEVAWAVYQDIVSAYQIIDRGESKKVLQAVIDALTTNLPTELIELTDSEESNR